jgi:hypothetical protein
MITRYLGVADAALTNRTSYAEGGGKLRWIPDSRDALTEERRQTRVIVLRTFTPTRGRTPTWRVARGGDFMIAHCRCLLILRISCALASLLGVLLSAPVAPLAAEDAPARPQLKSEVQPLSPLLGEWECAGEFTASKKPIAAHVSATPELAGAWLALRWDDKAPGVFHALELWGAQKTTHAWVNDIYDNFGGVRRFTSSGWEGNSLTWAGEAPAGASMPEERFVFERNGDSQFTVTWQVRKPGADWTTGDHLICRH